MSVLSNNLCWLRELYGYTQGQIAKVLNIDRSTYSYYEIGKTTPGLSALITLCRIFQVTSDQLVGDDLTAKPCKAPMKKRIDSDNKEELQVICYFRSFNENQRKKALKRMEEIVVNGYENES